MKLKLYLSTNKKSQVAFSNEVGVGHIYLNAIIRGRRKPSPSLALRIEEATGGAVSRLELLYPEPDSDQVE